MSINEEPISLTNTRSNRTTKALKLDKSDFDVPANEETYRARVKLGKETSSNREVSLVIKTVNNLSRNEQEEKMDSSDVWIGKYNMIKEAGIPVVPSVRKISDRQVAMTDLEADGSVVYGKADMFNGRATRALDHLLVQIDVNEVNKVAQEYARLADEAGILLANDDAFALVLSPNGEWAILALDVGLTERREDAQKEVHPSHLEGWNQVAAQDIFGYISLLQQKMERSS